MPLAKGMYPLGSHQFNQTTKSVQSKNKISSLSKNKISSLFAAPGLCCLMLLHPMYVFKKLLFTDRAIFGLHKTVAPDLLGRICSKDREP
jgi:hypothetical protein